METPNFTNGAMKAASGDLQWVVQTADEIKQGYLEFMKERAVPVQAQRELETVGQDARLSPSAKALESGERG